MLATPQTTDRTQALLALDRVLASRVFVKAERSRRFLRYLVEAALAEPPVAVKEYTLALDVFDRDKSYDPSIDATVRVEASRLRARLREYYLDEGRDDELVIDVPKGSYAATLSARAGSFPPAVAVSQPASLQDARPLDEPLVVESARPLRRRSRLVASLLALAAVLALTFITARSRSRTAPPPATATPPSLAILPIANRTGDPAFDLLTAGLTDDLIRQLSQLPNLKLISRNAVFRTRPANVNPLETGKALDVAAVLTGELRRTPDHTVLIAELSSTASGTVLLDREYLIENGDLRAAQADLQRDLIDKLHLEGSALDPGRLLPSVTSNPRAYREYLHGDALARTGQPAEMHEAIASFERAVALDPQFDLAWSALASAHVFLATYFEAPRDHMPQARVYAEHALKLNPSLGEAHGSLGLLHLTYDWNPAAAAAEMVSAGSEEAAISTLTCTAHLIGQTGKHRSAEEMISRMLTYDPNSASLIAELGCAEYYAGEYDLALRHYQLALAVDPHHPVSNWGLAKTLNAKHDYAQALAVLTAFKQNNGFEPPILTAERGYALGRAGRRAEARTVLQELATAATHTYIDPYFTAVIYASLNDREQAFLWLDKAYAVRSPFMISLQSEPKWDDWRADPRFAALMVRMQTSKTSA